MKFYGLDMIKALRKNEEVILFANILEINEKEVSKLKEFLTNEYEEEKLDYPFKPPNFDVEAALWSAKIIYISAQLILYRKHDNTELEHLLPIENLEINASTMISVDLCLRFMPIMLQELKIIDSEDPLIKILERILKRWHYSSINYTLENREIEKGNFTSKSFKQLYINRIVVSKNIKMAKEEPFYTWIKADLGIYEKELWNDFKEIIKDEEH